MKSGISIHSKFLTSIALSVATLAVCPSGLYSENLDHHIAHKVNQLEKRVSLLESNEIICGPITISHVHLGNQKTFLTLQPAQSVECSLHYALDSSQQEFFDKHYIIVGLEGVAAETAVTHLYGVWNSTGTKDFTLTAPLQDGDYEVKVAYYAADTAEEALNKWNVLKQEPSSNATIGIIRVQSSVLQAQ
jgi:hypothetical protein